MCKRSNRRVRLTAQIKVKAGVDADAPEVRRRCTAKRSRFRNRKRAAQAAIAASRKFGKPYKVYPCPLCGAFHLTSTPPTGNGYMPAKSDRGDRNGRLGRYWEPEEEDVMAVEHLVDRLLYLIGLDVRKIQV